MFGARVRKTRHKNSEFPYGASRDVRHAPVAPGCSSLNATPPGQWHITQVPGWPPSLAEGCTRIVFFAGTPAAEEVRRFISEIDPPPRASRSSALIFLYSASWVAVISSPSVPEWVFLHLFTQHPHGLRDQTVVLRHLADRAGASQRPPDTTCCLNSSLTL